MNAHTQIAGYSERQLDAFGFATTWQQTPLAIAELSKLDAAIAAYKASGCSDETYNALCDAETDITPALEEIREAVIFDLCTDSDHYDDLAEEAAHADLVVEHYIDAVMFGEAELRRAAA